GATPGGGAPALSVAARSTSTTWRRPRPAPGRRDLPGLLAVPLTEAVAERLVLAAGGLGQRGLEVDDPGAQVLVGRGQDAHGQQAGVAGAADGHRGDRDPGRHLHD